jgi:hypothetical protein
MLRLCIVAAFATIVVVALNVLLIKWMNGGGSSSDYPAVAPESPSHDTDVATDSRAPAPRLPLGTPSEVGSQQPDKITKTDLPSTKALTPPDPPTVSIKRLDPAEPQVGKSLEISLEANGKNQGKFTYQYRVKPGTKWEVAEGGRFKLSPTSAGPLNLEVRVVNERGEASPIITRRLVVKPMPEPAEKVVARFKVGDKFFQEVIVSRQSTYRILGVEMGQKVQYGFVSSFTVEKVEEDGSFVFTQKVETARWGEGDEDLKTLLADSLRKTEGAKFELTVSPSGGITKFKGAQDPVKVFGDKNPLGGQTFLLWSFLDDDSWKEFAQITFLQPDKPLRKGETWTRPFSHSWGPLGNWTGRTTYQALGKQAGLERIDYAHDLTYQPPKGASRDLPFKVQKADFKPQAAGGAILYHAAKGRVAAAEETFRVLGVLTLSVAGMEATVEMDEAQHFRLRVLEQKPAK